MSNKIEINLDKLTEKERKEWIEKLQAVDVKKPVKRWEDLKDRGKGYHFDPLWNYAFFYENYLYDKSDKRLCYTKKQALSCGVYPQLTKFMADVNGDWEADWTDDNQSKWCIERFGNELIIEYYHKEHCFLAFPKGEIAREFLTNHKELIEQFYQL